MKTYIDKLALIYVKDSKILVTRSKGKAIWYIPGGKRETGEEDLEALSREVREELSVQVIPETVEFYGRFTAQADGKPEGVQVVMTCYTADFEGSLKASQEIEVFDFFTFEDIDRVAHVDVLIFKDLKQRGLIG